MSNGPFNQQDTPWPTMTNGVGATLEPFSGRPDPNNSNIIWRQTLVDRPMPWLPYDKGGQIGFLCRWYVIQLTNGTANSEVPLPLRFDIPGTLYELAGAARLTTGAALPAPLDSFLIRLDSNQMNKLIIENSLGSAAVGTAQFPAKVGLSGWEFQRGSVAQFYVTPLFANLQITIVAKFIEVHGGANFS